MFTLILVCWYKGCISELRGQRIPFSFPKPGSKIAARANDGKCIYPINKHEKEGNVKVMCHGPWFKKEDYDNHIRYVRPFHNGNSFQGHVNLPMHGLLTIPKAFLIHLLIMAHAAWRCRMTRQKTQVRAACSCFLGLDLLSFECSLFLLSCWLLDFQSLKGSGMIWTKAWRKHDGMMVRKSDGSLRCQFVKLTYIRNCWMLSTVVGSINPKLA